MLTAVVGAAARTPTVLADASRSGALLKTALTRWTLFVDFEEHLEDVSKDWLNTKVFSL